MLKTREQKAEKRDGGFKYLPILQEAYKREIREMKERNWEVKKRLGYKNYF